MMRDPELHTDELQMRQIENHYLAIDPRRLSEMPERVVNLLGYKVHPPFIGYGMAAVSSGSLADYSS